MKDLLKSSFQGKVGSLLAFMLVAALMVAEPAHAADEFTDLYDMIAGWCQGALGKTIAVAFLIVGLGMGVVRGSVIGAVSAIAAGVALLMLPDIIDAMFTAAAV